MPKLIYFSDKPPESTPPPESPSPPSGESNSEGPDVPPNPPPSEPPSSNSPVPSEPPQSPVPPGNTKPPKPPAKQQGPTSLDNLKSHPLAERKEPAPVSKTWPTWLLVLIFGALFAVWYNYDKLRKRREELKLMEISSLLFMDEYDDVIEKSTLIITNQPQCGEAFYFRGLAKFMKGDYRAAIEDFNQVVELDNVHIAKRIGALTYSCFAFLELGFPEEALAVGTEAVSHNCAEYQSEAAFRGQGEAYERLGKMEDALVSYEKAIKLSPFNKDNLYRKANLLLKLDKNQEASQIFDTIIKLDPFDKPAYRKKGETLMNMGHLEEALKLVNKGIALHPDDANNFLQKGLILKKMGRHDEAKDCVERAKYILPH